MVKIDVGIAKGEKKSTPNSRVRVDFFSPFAIPTSILTIVLVNQIRTNCHVTIECVPCFTIKFCCTADVEKSRKHHHVTSGGEKYEICGCCDAVVRF